MATDAILIGLASFAIVWLMSFWYKMEWLRDKLGVYWVTDVSGEVADREDVGGIGAWVNCPQCMVVVSMTVIIPLWFFFKPGLVVLAGVGVAQIIIRWFEGARVKARWWT